MTATAQSLRKAMAAILESPINPALPMEIDEITRFASAALRAVEDEGVTENDRYIVLAELLDHARRQACLPDMAEEAVRREAAEVFGTALAPRIPTKWVARQRHLRRNGYDKCPVCLAYLLSDAEADRLDREERRAARAAVVESARRDRLRGRWPP